MTIWVAGMTCKACERRISNAPKTLPGVIPATASTRKGTAGLIATNQASRVTVDKTITAPGYGLGRSG
jgi:copper chaperone CopZ